MNKIRAILATLFTMAALLVFVPAQPAQALGPGQVCVASGATRSVTVKYGAAGNYNAVLIAPGQCSTRWKNAIGFRPPVGYNARWHWAEEGISTRTCQGLSSKQYCSVLGLTVIVTSVRPR